MVEPPGAGSPGAPLDSAELASTNYPDPPTHVSWDHPPPPLHDELPGYTHADNERFRRKSISQRMWEEHRRHEIALSRALEQDRLERQRTRESTMSAQRGGIFDRWIRWSAKFYMPLMNRWGDHHHRAHS